MTTPVPAKKPRARDAEATKARILAAATEEFARHGLAGARVDRIAERASANKRLIYVYLGDKRELFDAVIEGAVHELTEEVEITPEDLPGWAGRLFDHLVARPELVRLFAWRNLEGLPAGEAEKRSFGAKVEAIAAAQADGRLEDTYAPVDLLAMIFAVVLSWPAASPALKASAGGDPVAAERLEENRRAIVTMVGRALRGG